MQNLATPEQIQSGVPITFSLEVRVPQNGQQSIEQTPVLVKYQTTYGSVLPHEIPQATQHASDQLSQNAQQELQNQFGISMQPQQQQRMRFGQGSQAPWGQGSSWGQGQQAAAGGSR